MKILMMYCNSFEYHTSVKNLDMVENIAKSKSFEHCQLAFIQIEQSDEESLKSTVEKLVNFCKWICRKNETNKIVLHSFAHLSDSKADVEFSLDVFNKTEEKLKNAAFEVEQTPFGYFLDLKMDAPGFSLARVFKSF